MVLATCSEKILVAVFASDNFAAEIRWESLERPKREPHAVDEFSRLTRVLAVAVAKHLCGAISAGTSRRHSWRWESPTRCPSRLASWQAKALFKLFVSQQSLVAVLVRYIELVRGRLERARSFATGIFEFIIFLPKNEFTTQRFQYFSVCFRFSTEFLLMLLPLLLLLRS